jgi:hypothetical protein
MGQVQILVGLNPEGMRKRMSSLHSSFYSVLHHLRVYPQTTFVFGRGWLLYDAAHGQGMRKHYSSRLTSGLHSLRRLSLSWSRILYLYFTKYVKYRMSFLSRLIDQILSGSQVAKTGQSDDGCELLLVH